MPQTFYRVPFQIDHITAKQHGGVTILENLALSCFHESGELTRLYHPRRDLWEEHFKWMGATLTGLSAIKDPDYLAVRQALVTEGVFPYRVVRCKVGAEFRRFSDCEVRKLRRVDAA